jgi:hypothetical protein
MQTNGTLYSIFENQTKTLGYADDFDIIDRSQAEKRTKLKINKSKTKYMIAARNDRTICDKTIEVTEELVYLGFGFNKIRHLQFLDPPDPDVWLRDMDFDQEGGELTSRL